VPKGGDSAKAVAAAGAGLDAGRPVVEAAEHRGLDALSGFPFGVRTSASVRDQARRLADRCACAYSYLGDVLAFRPECALIVLDRSDWAERASISLYGMPYCSAGNLFLAGEPSDLAARLDEVARTGPPEAAEALAEVYGSGSDRMAVFADMLVVDELAHAFQDGVPFLFPRSWLSELFADMALYAFVHAKEHERLAHLLTLPQVVLDHGLIEPLARDLRYFEALYPHIEPLTYVWYQFRFTMMAKDRIDATGPDVLRRLWDAFVLSDEELARTLGDRIHPRAGEWLTKQVPKSA
jgi:hypothetical protein